MLSHRLAPSLLSLLFFYKKLRLSVVSFVAEAVMTRDTLPSTTCVAAKRLRRCTRNGGTDVASSDENLAMSTVAPTAGAKNVNVARREDDSDAKSQNQMNRREP